MNKNRRIVITGMGLVSPLGMNVEAFWENAMRGQSAIQTLSRFDSRDFKYQFAAQMTEFNVDNYLPRRLSKKLDRFTQYALIASEQAIKDSHLNLDTVDKNRIGIYVGNMFGGWEFTDRELRNLYVEGAELINPYLATAWFPAAPQGEISILHGIKGHSKTIDSGRSSGLTSIGYAAEAIRAGRLDYAIAGGTEAMVTPFMMAACSVASLMSEDHYLSPDGNYQPFGSKRNGWVPGEGSAFVMLETLESALARNAVIYAELQGFGHTTEACNPNQLMQDGSGLDRAISLAMNQSRIHFSDIDLVLADGAGTHQADLQEAKTIHHYFSGHSNCYVTAPKSLYGDTFGANGAFDIIISALSIKNQHILPTMIVDGIDESCPIKLVSNQAIESEINHVLINNRGYGGIGTALIASKYSN